MDKDIYGITNVINPHWEENWGDVIKTDHDYDGEFLIRLVTHKIKLLKNYFSNEDGCEEIVKSMDTCYKLGMKILTHNYGLEADKIFKEHGSTKWFFNKDLDPNYILWDKLSNEACEVRDNDIKEFFKLIGDNVVTWWIDWKNI